MPFRRRRSGSMRAPGPGWRARAAALAAAALACGLAPALPLAGDVPATVADDPSLPRLEAGGRTVHGRIVGDAGDPIVLVVHDGPGGDHRALEGLTALAAAPAEAERLAAEALGVAEGEGTYRVALYDQRGTGLSPRDGAPPGFEAALADLGDVADAVAGSEAGAGAGAGGIRLVGHGWGAMLAAAFLGRFPSRVAGAVLLEPLFLDAAAGERHRAGLDPPDDDAERLRALWRAYRSLAIFGPDAAARADWRAGGRLERRAARASTRPGCPPPRPPTYWRVGAAAPEAVWRSLEGADGRLDPGLADIAAGADRYGRPVRLVAGACSPLADAVAAQVGRFLDAHAVVVPGAGHDLVLDAPAAALAAVRGHLDALRAADAALDEAVEPEPAELPTGGDDERAQPTP